MIKHNDSYLKELECKAMMEDYIKRFFTILKEEDPKLYRKTKYLCTTGRGEEVKDILWEVFQCKQCKT
jgi:hypothetical protein